MISSKSPRAWVGLALVSLMFAVPALADPTNDLFNLFGQANSVAFANDFVQGERVSLVTKILAAIDSLDRGNENAAANQLGAFINEVEALERSGRLAPEDAEALISSANAIIDQL